MTRVIIRFKDGQHLNLPADCIDIRDQWVIAWNGEAIVVMAKVEGVDVCYLSEKKE